MTCGRHVGCEKTLRALKLIWLADTEAVVYNEYQELFDACYEDTKRIVACQNLCFLHRVIPESKEKSLFIILLSRILMNDYTTRALFERAVEALLASDVPVKHVINDVFRIKIRNASYCDLISKIQEFLSLIS